MMEFKRTTPRPLSNSLDALTAQHAEKLAAVAAIEAPAK